MFGSSRKWCICWLRQMVATEDVTLLVVTPNGSDGFGQELCVAPNDGDERGQKLGFVPNGGEQFGQ